MKDAVTLQFGLRPAATAMVFETYRFAYTVSVTALTQSVQLTTLFPRMF